MAVQKIGIENFLRISSHCSVFDVRSPGEYHFAHIPQACNLPLFSDEERKIIGTLYKQKSREAAIKQGLDFFGVKMKEMIEKVETFLNDNWKKAVQEKNTILLYCWRGGMRSAGVAWLLDLYGYKVYTLAGGYKTYRKWVLSQFEKPYNFLIVGGYSGSGKTAVLQELKKNKPAIDLEALANHKGSAFGALPQEQPKQEMFENKLAHQLALLTAEKPTTSIFIEDESQRIGNLQIPVALWNSMRKSPVYFLSVPFEERLHYIAEEYGKVENEKLINAVIRIQKRLGGLATKQAIHFIQEDDYKSSFRILLAYYDKWYDKGLQSRENLSKFLHTLSCETTNAISNAEKIINYGKQ